MCEICGEESEKKYCPECVKYFKNGMFCLIVIDSGKSKWSNSELIEPFKTGEFMWVSKGLFERLYGKPNDTIHYVDEDAHEKLKASWG